MPREELDVRLKNISERIRTKRAELEQRGIFDKSHELTQQDLEKRAQILEKELEEEVAHSETGEKVTKLERSLLNWVNSLDIDAK